MFFGGVYTGGEYNTEVEKQMKRTVQKLEESKKSPEPKNPKPGDVRVVNINGRPTVMVIGREYEIKLKDGACPTLLSVEEE
jgi:hypothetical protein